MSEERRASDVLIAKARGDAAAAIALADRSEVPDAVVGFHAQQAVEKALKAVLLARGVNYQFRHDIAYLCELLDDDGVQLPDEVARADTLTPWAAEFRYEDPPSDESFDRGEAVETASRVLAWAASQLEA
ncbi:MAG: HEPN domain-containing protein [Solirubrobacteraceae bacterium]|jgi:HEPN domain-containing protein